MIDKYSFKTSLFVALLLIGCAKNKTATNGRIIGTWQAYEYKTETYIASKEILLKARELALSTTYVFETNKTGFVIDNLGLRNFKWEIASSKILLEFGEGKKEIINFDLLQKERIRFNYETEIGRGRTEKQFLYLEKMK